MTIIGSRIRQATTCRARRQLRCTKGVENGQGHALTPGTALCTIAFPNRGALAQLGERHNGIVEVMGSSPISSIRIRRCIGTGL